MGTPLVLPTGIAWADNITCTGGPCDGTNRNDKITGTAGADVPIRGLRGDDVINGLGEADELRGGRGNDRVDGGPGNDKINGDPGDDTLLGGDGDDRYEFYGAAGPADWGIDTIDDSGGTTNSLSFSGINTPLRLDFVASPVADEARSGNNTLNFTATFDVTEADGGTGDDVILGNHYNNFLNGLEGNDFLDGRLGEDTLMGEAGDDTIYAVDREVDRVECGDGNDTVYYDDGAVADVLIDCEDKHPVP
jgi:Ca2+-binding RTX toxin-like protein